MSFWDGTHWVDEKAATPVRRPSRLTNWAATAVMMIGIAAIATPLQFTAAASRHRSDPPCTITPSPAAVGSAVTLSATGLPTVDPVWLIVQPPSGGATVSEAYVDQATGTWSGTEFVTEAGTWTYTFDGLLVNRKYGTVSACSVDVT
jgi:hypothetical protein